MFTCILATFFLFVTLARSVAILSTVGTNATALLIKENSTSNYYFSHFSFGTTNVTFPFAIGRCSVYNTNGDYFLPRCMSNKLLNVSYYTDSSCKNMQRHVMVNDTSLFRCNASNNYASLSINVGTSCPGIYDISLAINHCHYTGSTYANILCKNNLLQYVYYNDSECKPPVEALNSATSTCSQIFTVDNVNIYGSFAQCANNLSLNVYPASTASSSSSTTLFSNSTVKSNGNYYNIPVLGLQIRKHFARTYGIAILVGLIVLLCLLSLCCFGMCNYCYLRSKRNDGKTYQSARMPQSSNTCDV